MEIRVELAEDLVEELDDEAMLQGFDDRGAYLRWIIAHRPMSNLASSQAPAVATRVSELEERVKLLERQLDLDNPSNPDADLGGGAGAGGGASLDTPSGGSTGGAGDDASLADGFESKAETVDLDDPQGEPEPDEEGAEDDDIADAIGDISLDDDE